MLWTGLLMSAGTVGLGLAPTWAPWLWLSLFAIGNGPIFPLSLTLPLDAARDTSDAANLVMWTLGLGYLMASFGPVLVGWLRDASGGFALPLLALAAAGCASGLLALLAPAPRAGAAAPAREGVAV
jgi:MFS transporter, CP family, cyanate transporter